MIRARRSTRPRRQTRANSSQSLQGPVIERVLPIEPVPGDAHQGVDHGEQPDEPGGHGDAEAVSPDGTPNSTGAAIERCR